MAVGGNYASGVMLKGPGMRRRGKGLLNLELAEYLTAMPCNTKDLPLQACQILGGK